MWSSRVSSQRWVSSVHRHAQPQTQTVERGFLLGLPVWLWNVGTKREVPGLSYREEEEYGLGNAFYIKLLSHLSTYFHVCFKLSFVAIPVLCVPVLSKLL